MQEGEKRDGQEVRLWSGEEFETFATHGLITRTNHANPSGYLEISEASKMFCGKHHTFSNA